jgi:hypothetical protein
MSGLDGSGAVHPVFLAGVIQSGVVHTVWNAFGGHVRPGALYFHVRVQGVWLHRALPTLHPDSDPDLNDFLLFFYKKDIRLQMDEADSDDDFARKSNQVRPLLT